MAEERDAPVVGFAPVDATTRRTTRFALGSSSTVRVASLLPAAVLDSALGILEATPDGAVDALLVRAEAPSLVAAPVVRDAPVVDDADLARLALVRSPRAALLRVPRVVLVAVG